jgi:UDP-2-acetamido-3-amino-2,3-dideoxy-glucuronate N-acetyltransferase
LVTGVPARQIGWMCRCGVRLSDGNDDVRQCKACGQRYRETSAAGRKSLQPETTGQAR